MSGIFVAGATGYTGRAVVAAGRAQGLDVHAHVRPDSTALATWQARFTALGAVTDATPWDEAAMAGTLARVEPDAVLACLGTTARRAGAEGLSAVEGYERVDYGLTALLLRACREACPTGRFVYLSSLGATPRTRNAYLRARGRIEEELVHLGIPYTIARPSFITGDDRDEPRPLERISARVAGGGLAVLRALGARRVADRYDAMTGAELGTALVKAALDPGCEGRILDAADLRALL